MYTLRQVKYLDELTSSFEVLKPFFELALTKAPEYSLADVVRDVLSGASCLWVAESGGEFVGVVTTRINNYPQRKTMLIHLLGGKDIDRWVGTIGNIEAVASEMGCDDVAIHGRPAWKKLLPEYNTERIILTKDL